MRLSMTVHSTTDVLNNVYDGYKELTEVGWPFEWISIHSQHRNPDVLSFGEHGDDHRVDAQTAANTPPTITTTAPIPPQPSHRTTNHILRSFPDPISYQMAICK